MHYFEKVGLDILEIHTNHFDPFGLVAGHADFSAHLVVEIFGIEQLNQIVALLLGVIPKNTPARGDCIFVLYLIILKITLFAVFHPFPKTLIHPGQPGKGPEQGMIGQPSNMDVASLRINPSNCYA